MQNFGNDPLRFGFPLTDEHLAVYTAARSFSQNVLKPKAAERDRERAFPVEIFPELASLGLLAMRVSPEWGGSGVDVTSYGLAMVAIGEGDAAVGAIVASSNLSAVILAKYGNDAQRARWLKPYAEGRLGPASFALTEPSTGSDASAIKTTAVRDGAHWVINGAKQWITSGAHSGVSVVFVRTTPEAGARGLSCLVVEKGTPGFTAGREEHKMGLRASGAVGLHFEDCRVPKENLLGSEGQGYEIALGALGPGRIGIAAQSIGIAEAAYAEGVKYATDRIAFGQSVASFQHSQFTIADSRCELDGAWLMMLRGAALCDRGEQARAETSMAKITASEVSGRVVDRMLQLHGGYGYSEEYPIERLYRDARITRIYEGTNEIQRMLVAREILGREKR